MARRRWYEVVVLGFSLLVADCSGPSLAAPNLPNSASFGWKLVGMNETKPEDAPELLRTAGFRTSWRADYSGPGTAHVDVYRTKSKAAGLDLAQRWKPEPETVTVFNNSYFLVISWHGANRAAATALVGQIERSLPNTD